MKKEAKIELVILVFSIIFLIFLTRFVVAAGQAPEWNETLSFPLKSGDFPEDLAPAFFYNVSANASDPEGDSLTFTLSTGDASNPIWSSIHGSQTNSFFSWIDLNSTTGILTINSTTSNQSGIYNISMDVSDGTSGAGARVFIFNVTAINDAPEFSNLQNRSFNETELFEYVVNVSDEEDDNPFSINLTFLSCEVESWSDRNCATYAGRELFNTNNYTFNTTTGQLNISFTPGRKDVGNYTINFTITDSGNDSLPANASRNKVITFRVLNINDAPYFTNACDNYRNATEDTTLNCFVNATDLDETSNLTFKANYTWFTFNNSATSTELVSMTSENISALVNFTASDIAVGNWSVNLTVNDTGAPSRSNSTIFYFFVHNINDSVSLGVPPNFTAFTSNNYTIYINATDDDLLVTQKNIFNETLTFTPNESTITLTGTRISGTNITELNISFDPVDLNVGSNYINISVHDSNNFSFASEILNITVVNNTPPQWNLTTNKFVINEDAAFYVNFSINTSDIDGDQINFSNVSDNSFPAFFINTSTGVVNFTPLDADVGEHEVNITATDGKTPSKETFNFTIINVNDVPDIYQITAIMGTVDGVNVTSAEDDAETIRVWVTDDDFLIPSSSENISLNWTVEGPNYTLITFTQSPGFIPYSSGQTRFVASFIAGKNDLGTYNITLNATDTSGASDVLRFNLTITGVEHPPVMSEVGDLDYSIFEAINLDVNATDEEDLNETYIYSNMTYVLTNLTAYGDFLTINETTGIINFSFNRTLAGRWRYNITVNDSAGSGDSEVFNISVYDYPVILSPTTSFEFNLKENVSSILNFSVNHTVQDNLNYTIYFGTVLRNSTSGLGTGADFLYNITTNFTEETTCSGTINLTLNVSNAKLSNTTTWNLTINHTNYPLSFITSISDRLNQASPVIINLSDHYQDIDASDPCINQTIGFNHTVILNSTTGTISVALVNWTNAGVPSMTFTSSTDAVANYTISAFEYTNASYGSAILGNVSSNNFSINLEISTTTTPTPSTGGGGGSRKKKEIISLKILVPEPVSARKKDKLVIPLGVVNDGTVDLNEIVLDGIVAKDGLLRTDLIASFDRSFIEELPAGSRENVTMVVDIDTTATGIFEVTINASVRDPEYNDWAKFYIEIDEKEDVLEKIIFTEEFIVGNPECVELKEIMDRARNFYSLGDFNQANLLTEEALSACKQAIAQPPSQRVFERIRGQILNYVTLASILAVVLGLGYYYYQRIRLKRALRGY